MKATMSPSSLRLSLWYAMKKIKPQETVEIFSLRLEARIRYKKVRFRIKHPSCVLLKDDGMICANVKSNIILTKVLEFQKTLANSPAAPLLKAFQSSLCLTLNASGTTEQLTLFPL